MTKERKTPADAQDATETHDGNNVPRSGAPCLDLCTLEVTKPAKHHDEDGEGEEEDNGVVAHVHHILNAGVQDPAPD